MRSRLWVGIGTPLLAAACSSSGGLGAAPIVASAGSAGTAGSHASGGSHAGSQAGSAGKGSSADGDAGGGAAGAGDVPGTSGAETAGASSAGSAGAPPTPSAFPCAAGGASAPPTTAQCDPSLAFSRVAAVPVDAGNAARLIGITPDTLTIAWSALGSSSVQFFVADRASSDEAFGPALPITTADNVVGLSPDGLRLVTLSQDGKSYQELTRDLRGLDFDAASAAAFSILDAAATASSLVYADSVISADDHALIYTALSGDGQEYPVKISVRSGSEPWPVGAAITSCELQRHGDLVRHPTGLAADGLTLFFFDPDRHNARAAWRASASAAFSYFADLAGVGRAAVDSACSELYYSSAAGDTMLLVGSGS